MSSAIETHWKRGQDFLGCQYPILCGAMSWISEHNLVSAVANAGGFGIIASGALMPDVLRKEIELTIEKTDRRFGVNVISLHAMHEELIQICLEYPNVSHVVLGGAIPRLHSIQLIKNNSDKKVICFAPSASIALRLLKNGVDAFIIEGSEAGGHIGPLSTSVLLQEVLPFLKNKVPVFIAGGIGSGAMVAHCLRLGVSGCQLGTRFVCAHESIAHPRFKKCFIKANSRDAVASVQFDPDFPVIPVRAIKNHATVMFQRVQKEAIRKYHQNEMTKQEAQLEIEKFWAGALRRAAIHGDIETGSVMAGQSVGMITCEQSAQEIFEEILSQMQESISPEKTMAWM